MAMINTISVPSIAPTSPGNGRPHGRPLRVAASALAGRHQRGAAEAAAGAVRAGKHHGFVRVDAPGGWPKNVDFFKGFLGKGHGKTRD